MGYSLVAGLLSDGILADFLHILLISR